jgi:hypothetical protein
VAGSGFVLLLHMGRDVVRDMGLAVTRLGLQEDDFCSRVVEIG